MTLRSVFVQSAFVALSFATVACGNDAAVSDDVAETTVVATPKVDAVTGFIDPACQMTIKEDASITHTHEGVTYGFCGEGCKAAFVAEPATFLAALEE
ncbi:MAG: YHS domain-containing protein [Saprospiraceae bacterium]